MGLIDAVLHDRAGNPVGKVVEILVDPATRQPRWLRVGHAANATDGVLVPAVTVSETAPGVLTTAYDSDTISSARHAGGAVTDDEASRLTALYDLPDDGRAP